LKKHKKSEMKSPVLDLETLLIIKVQEEPRLSINKC